MPSPKKRILRVSIPVAFASYIRSGLSTVKQILIPYSLERSGINCTSAISKYGIITGMVMPIIYLPSVFIESFSRLLFCIFLNILFFVFSKNISILIYKNDSISTYLKTLSFVISFLYIDIVIDSILKGLDKQVPVMIINVIDLIVSICFIYFFVPILGVTGYVVSIFLSEVLNFVLSALVLYNAFKTNYNSN